jgi:hypothetical protein
MPKDDMDTETMNELFNSDDEPLPHYHWFPVSLYHDDGTKIRDLTREEQIQWIKQQKERER